MCRLVKGINVSQMPLVPWVVRAMNFLPSWSQIWLSWNGNLHSGNWVRGRDLQGQGSELIIKPWVRWETEFQSCKPACGYLLFVCMGGREGGTWVTLGMLFSFCDAY